MDKLGKCHICGKEFKLTYEHVPPSAANNSVPAKVILFDPDQENFDSTPWELSGRKYVSLQRGVGDYTLCKQCNSQTGREYNLAYLKFYNGITSLFSRNSKDEQDFIEVQKVIIQQFLNDYQRQRQRIISI